MNWITTLLPILEIASATSSGILAGALLTEARVLVPYWREMEPKEFLGLHHRMGPSLYRFFAPITIAGTLLPLITFAAALLTNSTAMVWWAVSALLGATMLAIYFAYFKGANESFATGSVGEQGLPAELSRWAFWHNLRTAFAVIGAVAAIIAVSY